MTSLIFLVSKSEPNTEYALHSQFLFAIRGDCNFCLLWPIKIAQSYKSLPEFAVIFRHVIELLENNYSSEQWKICFAWNYCGLESLAENWQKKNDKTKRFAIEHVLNILINGFISVRFCLVVCRNTYLVPSRCYLRFQAANMNFEEWM